MKICKDRNCPKSLRCQNWDIVICNLDLLIGYNSVKDYNLTATIMTYSKVLLEKEIYDEMCMSLKNRIENGW